MAGISGTLGIILVFLTLVSLVAAAVAVARASYIKELVAGLRGDRDDLRVRVDLLEAEKNRVSEELNKAEAKIQVLEHLTSGKDQLDRIEEAISTFIEHVTERDERMFDRLGHIEVNLPGRGTG